MELTLTEDQRALVDSVVGVVAKYAPIENASAVAATPSGYSAELFDQAVGLGWTGLGLEDASVLELALVLEQFGRQAVASPYPAMMAAGLVVHRLGTTDRARELVGRIVTGTRATLVTPVHGRAEPADGRVRGEFRAVEWADGAAEFVVAVPVPDGVRLVAVPATADGVTVTPTAAMDNERVGTVTLDVAVDADAELGVAEPAAWRSATLLGAALRAAEIAGGAERALAAAVEHVQQRNQFGGPIGRFQAVQHHVANMRMDADAATLLTRSAVWRAAVGRPFERQAAMAAWFAGTAAERVTSTTNQLHGGIGFMREYWLHHLFHRAKAQQLRLGTARAQLAVLGDLVLEAHARGFRAEFVDWPA